MADMMSCVWKECSSNVEENRKYVLDKENPRIIKYIGSGSVFSNTIGTTPLPPNKVTSWHIKVVRSKFNDGSYIAIGVAPFDIDPNCGNEGLKLGWFYYCFSSSLYSGYPRLYREKPYGPMRGNGQYVRQGDRVGVVMDTTNGDLSFHVGGSDFGLAFEGIPLDKPLVPCVCLSAKDDSVEFDPIGVIENSLDEEIPVPTGITTSSRSSDTITVKWEPIDYITFYQIEVEGRRTFEATAVTKHTINDLEPATGYNIRVRVVRGGNFGRWSESKKEFTQKQYNINWGWKDCPSDTIWFYKYEVSEENPKIAKTLYQDHYSTIIGNSLIPPTKVSRWGVRILKSEHYDGYGIYIGVAPADIDQGDDNNYKKCGWYFNCHGSALCSGPPHNYKDKEYGPKKQRGKYVSTKRIVGVVMDVMKGQLSFSVDGVDMGLAYDEIPTDKPLVPCAILYMQDDSVKLVTEEDLASDDPKEDKDCIIS